MSAEPKYARAIRVIGVGLVLTWVGVVLGTLLECRPFSLYCMYSLHSLSLVMMVFARWTRGQPLCHYESRTSELTMCGGGCVVQIPGRELPRLCSVGTFMGFVR